MEYAVEMKRKDILGRENRILKSTETSQPTDRTTFVARAWGALWRLWLMWNLRVRQESEHGDCE